MYTPIEYFSIYQLGRFTPQDIVKICLPRTLLKSDLAPPDIIKMHFYPPQDTITILNGVIIWNSPLLTYYRDGGAYVNIRELIT